MGNKQIFVGLDIGAKRIGVAVGDSIARLAQPVTTITADDHAAQQLQRQLIELDATDVVVGRPRNQAGDTTAQTRAVEQFVAVAVPRTYPLHWQDESVTSVIAEQRLEARKKPYTKQDIDAEAAAIILQDYLETL